jgi:hydroxypyruvate isomerase
VAERQRSEKQLANDKIMELFLSEFPPDAKWNNTMWTRQLSILRKALLNQGYSFSEIAECIVYAKKKGKRVHSLSFLCYIIEESKQYWTQLREREAERMAMLESQAAPVQLDAVRKPNVPGWLRVDDDIEEVE